MPFLAFATRPSTSTVEGGQIAYSRTGAGDAHSFLLTGSDDIGTNISGWLGGILIFEK